MTFEIGDLRQLGQDVVLHAIGERRVSFSSPRGFKRKTAIPVVPDAGSIRFFQTIQQRLPPKRRDKLKQRAARMRRTHFLLRPMIPVCRAKIGSCFSQRSKSSASVRAEMYRRFGSFSRHFKQIVRGRGLFSDLTGALPRFGIQEEPDRLVRCSTSKGGMTGE